MRRSKSNPAKYTRGYRRISQRRMTEHDDDEEEEMERLRGVLATTAEQMQSARADTAVETPAELNDSILELNDEPVYGEDEADVILPGHRPKKSKQAPRVHLTDEELRQASRLHKKTQRKLQQLEERATRKRERADVYARLEASAVNPQQRLLLQSSSALGQKRTKRQELQRLLQKERAGLELTEEERGVLYADRPEEPEPASFNETMPSAPAKVESSPNTARKKRKRKEAQGDSDQKTDESIQSTQSSKVDSGVLPVEPEETNAKAPSVNAAPATSAAASSFAAQMMASLTQLKTMSTADGEKAVEEKRRAEEERERLEVEKHKPAKRYVPSEPAKLQTAATLGLKQQPQLVSTCKVMEITRPPEIQACRYDLPVSAMEFEVMDAIRNNDVTIICGETGSGKSTQIPQFIYESGMTLLPEHVAAGPDHFLIGITQPRRVAAVSTAKRVCYEMGQGNGQTIPNKGKGGSLVAYQTRYERAGLGDKTHIKFMTDGILLQEIQSDLLLRKYSVIVLDEAHERNLNTDVLIGLLSVAIPLRSQAAKEGSWVPLKLVIMSATLRVEDFTANDKLFASLAPPAVVTIPGRTYPVTIHHSKVTELDNYEDAAFKKICKIHKKLPQGGILVFLTGKHEILKMVRKLRRALASETVAATTDVALTEEGTPGGANTETPRDLDDEELDGDLFVDSEEDEVDVPGPSQSDVDGTGLGDSENTNDNIPKKAHILPLYSLLSVDDQAKVFAPVPEGHRLIVLATNIAETSITIPGISYVVDSGRHKCRNYNAGTGVASYDIMWISKAAADQRAGRAGRTGPGHCYRLYSSSMYTRQMEDFAPPEVLTRPLEDVVLAMKAMKISNVSNFPFPTPPARHQLKAAVQILANIGCVDVSNADESGGDGEITRLGAAVSKLPLGVRYGKMLLVAAQAGVLDYAIVLVAALSENSPFLTSAQPREIGEGDSESADSQDARSTGQNERSSHRWRHRGGDVLAVMLAAGAYAFAGRGAGGAAEKLACRKFCDETGLSFPIMQRIHKMRTHLARLALARLPDADGVASKTGGYLHSMKPPNKLQERLLCQSIGSGLLDNVAMLAPPGSINGEHPYSLRSAYIGCSWDRKDPLFLDRNSVVFSRDTRILPPWICFDSLVTKTLRDGTTVAVMKNITPLEPSWLGSLAKGSRLLHVGDPLPTPAPIYDDRQDAVLCCVNTQFGNQKWEIPPVRVEMFDAVQRCGTNSPYFTAEDSFRWFARFLLEGKVIPALHGLTDFLSDSPSLLTRGSPAKKTALLVSALSGAGIDTAAALKKHWSTENDKFLFKHLKLWVKPDRTEEAKRLWINAVRTSVDEWKASAAR